MVTTRRKTEGRRGPSLSLRWLMAGTAVTLGNSDCRKTVRRPLCASPRVCPWIRDGDGANQTTGEEVSSLPGVLVCSGGQNTLSPPPPSRPHFRSFYSQDSHPWKLSEQPSSRGPHPGTVAPTVRRGRGWDRRHPGSSAFWEADFVHSTNYKYRK